MSSYPLAFLNYFQNDADLSNAFLSLPEEVQQALLREPPHTQAALREQIENHMRKQ